MELFASDDRVAALQSTLMQCEGIVRLETLIELAWQLRQRDCARSLVLADEADLLLKTASIDDTERCRSAARLMLVRGEIHYLFVDLDAAENLAKQAIVSFERIGDMIGAGDGSWLMASICLERGDAQRRDAYFVSAIDDYKAGKDMVRASAGTARRMHHNAFRDAKATAAELARSFGDEEPGDSLTKAWLASARAVLASLTGDPGSAIKYFGEAYRAAEECGHVRHAILTGSNAADSFATLGDLDTALEWNERNLALARTTRWPGAVGMCLFQTGNVLRLLGRYAEANETLREALTVLEKLAGSKSFTVTLVYLGDLSLDIGDPAAALDYFGQAEERAVALGEPGFVMRCRRGQANALGRLGQPEEAGARLGAGLELAQEQGNADEQIKVLRVYAELYHQYQLPTPAGMTAPSAALHYLNQAQAVAATISGYTLPGELLDEIASAYAASGDYHLAYVNALAAAAARSSSRLDDARKRAIAMRMRQETERARAESEHHRQLAEAEAKRATALQEAGATLETLGLVGREITACLDAEAVYAALYRHVNQLLDATSFDVYLLQPDGVALSGAFAIEDGKPSPLVTMKIDDPKSFTARSARERSEICIDLDPGKVDAVWVPGTLITLSLLFAPLLIGERLLGVMSIQSVHAHAYGERESSIFRALCAYGAIALDNAGAYARAESARQQASLALLSLREAQAKLVQSETMASLGTLVAGIAHEINTPLGVCVTATSHLEEELLLTLADQAKGQLGEQGLAQFFEAASDTVRILKSNTQRAAKLIQSFKQVSVDQASGEMRSVNLVEYLNEVLATLGPSLKNKPVSVSIVGPAGLRAHTYPGALAQVTTNLIMNSVIHGVGGKDSVAITIKVAREADTLRLQYSDNGRGMEPGALKRLFDPFYTTTRGTGGSGLGAHIVYNLITGPLAGEVQVSSTPGQGLQYDICMPLDLGGTMPSAIG